MSELAKPQPKFDNKKIDNETVNLQITTMKC